jgi:hypothetical protein
MTLNNAPELMTEAEHLFDEASDEGDPRHRSNIEEYRTEGYLVRRGFPRWPKVMPGKSCELNRSTQHLLIA